MRRFTPNTITSRRQFVRTLAKVREQGCSVDNEETELGASCVAVPILNATNFAVAGISISGPSPRIREKQKRMLLLNFAVAVFLVVAFRSLE
jgi:IclR family acetate operon transcriptional repressor